MALGGVSDALKAQCLQVTRLHETTFALHSLRVPISASRLSKVECNTLVDKIKAKVHILATGNLSFAGRAKLINSVIFEMFNYWVSIFLLPPPVVESITKLCRNYLWGGCGEFKRISHISWNTTCMPKNQGGIGMENLYAWKAIIPKLVWAVKTKKGCHMG